MLTIEKLELNRYYRSYAIVSAFLFPYLTGEHIKITGRVKRITADCRIKGARMGGVFRTEQWTIFPLSPCLFGH